MYIHIFMPCGFQAGITGKHNMYLVEEKSAQIPGSRRRSTDRTRTSLGWPSSSQTSDLEPEKKHSCMGPPKQPIGTSQNQQLDLV